jgi:hypothetical protein
MTQITIVHNVRSQVYKSLFVTYENGRMEMEECYEQQSRPARGLCRSPTDPISQSETSGSTHLNGRGADRHADSIQSRPARSPPRPSGTAASPAHRPSTSHTSTVPFALARLDNPAPNCLGPGRAATRVAASVAHAKPAAMAQATCMVVLGTRTMSHQS